MISINKDIDILFDYIDILLSDDKFNTVDLILKQINVDETDISLLIAFLTISVPARNKLKHYDILAKKCWKKEPNIELWSGLI